MIRISLRRVGGQVYRVTSTGHAVTAEGVQSAPCAAVSVLLKAFGLTVVESRRCVVSGDASQPGRFDLVCEECANPEWFRGLTELLERSLGEIQQTWPEQVHIDVIEE